MWKTATFTDTAKTNLENDMVEFLNENKVKDFKIVKNTNNISITIIYLCQK